MKTITKNIQNADHIALLDVMKWVEKRTQEGWTCPSPKDGKLLPRRYGPGNYYIQMIKLEEGDIPPVPTVPHETPEEAVGEETTPTSLLDQLESLSKKDELLGFAKKHGIIIPEDVKVVMAIRKYIKEFLENLENETQV